MAAVSSGHEMMADHEGSKSQAGSPEWPVDHKGQRVLGREPCGGYENNMEQLVP